ncbi:C3a anaphylatoxin chemotactic receptor [Tachyglossus aculeatus]|uniref:C3a anaphylatoxin chemotactic receptor n=1 Tax=Tachyglossus aculeatus TaxID=9261 RepID=UPI0018F64488|nr:C3a anaphylatoxin chemotactic receptor [Tachyglossus aculeatus]
MGRMSVPWGNTSSPDSPLQQSHSLPELLSMVILSFTLVLGLLGNGLVMWVAGWKMQRTVTTVWFLHLTAADLLCCLSLPFSLAHLALGGHWPHGQLLCKLVPATIVLNMFASVFLLTVISLDRCLLVTRPVWCQNHRGVRLATAVCGAAWVLAFVLCLPILLYRETYVDGPLWRCGYNFGHHASLDGLEDTGLMDIGLVGFSDSSPPTPEMDDLGTLDVPLRARDALLTGSDWLLGSSLPWDPLDTKAGHPSSIPNPDLSPRGDLLPTEMPSQPPGELDLDTDFWDDLIKIYAAESQVPGPLVAMTLTRLGLGFLVPLAIMVACYSVTVVRVQSSRFAVGQTRTFWLATRVVAAFFTCWAPYHLVGVLSLLATPDSPLDHAVAALDPLTQALASANSCINPLLYALAARDFRVRARLSLRSILEAAFSEGLSHSSTCPPSQAVALSIDPLGTEV